MSRGLDGEPLLTLKTCGSYFHVQPPSTARSDGVDGYPLDQCWRENQAHALFGLVLTIAASLGVQRTERGDAMFATMARRVADQILANDSFAALASL